MKIAEFQVQNERGVKACSRRVRLFAGLAGLTRRQRVNLGNAFSGVSRLAISRGGKLHVEFGFVAKAGRPSVEIVVRSSAPDVQANELEDFAQLVDQFHLSCDDKGHALARLGQQLPAEAHVPHEVELFEWGQVLLAKSAESALIASRKRMRTGPAELAAAQQRTDELQEHLDLETSSLETLNMLTLVANKTDNLVMVLDPLGVVEWVNAAFVKLTGFTFRDICGTRPIEVLCEKFTSDESRRALDEALQLGHGVSEELQLCRKDGSPFWTSLTLTPVSNESGDVSHWIGVGADITRRRQTHEVLEKAKETAEAASRAKSDFLANMSHEIRTPMNAIIGMTELALGTALTNEQREYLSSVKQSADALLELLNDILDLSKIEAGKMEIETIPFNLNELLTSTLGALAVRAHVNGLELAWRLPPEVPARLKGDPTRLRQIVINLVSNAIKFTEQGQVTVTVESQWESDKEVALHFAVADTGIGISPDRLDRIFNAFEQADSSTTRRYGGTGLGLTICNHLTRLLGGKIWVQSQIGRGSTFHFSLRFQKGAEPLAAYERPDHGELLDKSVDALVTAFNQQSARALGAGANSAGDEMPARPLKILVADDHPANRDLVAAILRKRGHRVSFAVNGRDALRAVEQEPFDVVLMDVQMPEMDGFQATAAMRRRERETQTHVPIVALTAHAMKGDREKCLAAGMDAYLPKPINANELRTLVECLVKTNDPAFVAAPPLPAAKGPLDFDFSAALERLAGDRDLLRRQMEFFLEDSPKLLCGLRSSIAKGDGKSLKIAAHRLKGLLASYDAHRAAHLALQLETLGNKGELEGAETIASQLHDRIGHLRQAIQQYLGR